MDIVVLRGASLVLQGDVNQYFRLRNWNLSFSPGQVSV